VVGSLCEAYREVARSGPAGHMVNLLFDHRTDGVEVESPYTHGELRVRVLRPGPLFVWVPPWVGPEELEVGAEGRHLRTGGYIFSPEPPTDRHVVLRFPLKEQEMCLSGHVHPIRVRGDEVVAMDNFGADLTFFENYEP